MGETRQATAPAVATVLVVDDDPAVRELLGTALVSRGHRVLHAASGEEALALAAAGGIDLAVVDVVLPGIDGLAVTRRLKELAPADTFFPVVVVTGDGVNEAVAGFAAGCDDFLAKPVRLVELDARLRSLLARRSQQAALAHAAADLRKLHRMKQDLAALLVHDLRNPLSALQGNLQLLRDELPAPTGLVADILHDCEQLSERALSLVGGLLDVEELEDGLLHAEPTEVAVADFARRCASSHTTAVRTRGLQLDFAVAPGLRARFDVELIGRLLENLLDNAVRYAQRGGRVEVAAEIDGHDLALRVGNDGPAVPDEERARVFDRFYRIEARRAGARANRGLGLYFCRLAAAAHGGTIDVGSAPGLPACFFVRLPQ